MSIALVLGQRSLIMLKWVWMVLAVGFAMTDHSAEAQRRGYGPTRGDRDRWQQQHRPPPVVIIPPHHQPFASYSLVESAARGNIVGCSVNLRADGYHHHLYVRGSFAGAYRAGVEDHVLASAIDLQLRRGVCFIDGYVSGVDRVRSQVLSNPYLIEDFANGYSANCHVRLGVSGWANQVYINGHFSGNYNQHHERERLRQDLATYVANGTCQYRF
jgi:hypothetical protein